MTPVSHVIISVATSGACAYFTRSWPAVISCFLGGTIIDIDHFADYCLFRKKISFRLSDLLKYCYDERKGHMYLIFHAWELWAVLWVLAFVFGAGVGVFSFLFGVTVHLLLDQAVNDVYPMAYFWFYRRKFKFTKKVFHDSDFRKEFIRK